MCAAQVANVFAFPTMEGRSVTNVHLGTMDIQTVLVSGLDPSMSTSGSLMVYQLSACDLNVDGKMLLLVSLGLLWPLLMTLRSKHPHSPTVPCENPLLSSTLIYLQHFTESWNMTYTWTWSIYGIILLEIDNWETDVNQVLETNHEPSKAFSY